MTPEERASDEGEFVLRHYLHLLHRRWRLIILVSIVVVALGMTYAFTATPIYRAEATILIEKQAPRLMKDVQEVVQFQASDQSDYYKTQVELVKSRAVLEKALQRPGVRELLSQPARPSLLGKILGRRPASSEKGNSSGQAAANPGNVQDATADLWKKLRGLTDAEQKSQTYMLIVKVRNPDPEHAATLADAVASAFEQYHVDRKFESSKEAFGFLEQQMVKQEKTIAEARDALRQFSEKENVVSGDVAANVNPGLLRRNKVSDELVDAQIKRVEVEAKLAGLRQALLRANEAPQSRLDEAQVAAFAAAEGANPVIERLDRIKDQLAAVRLEHTQLTAQLKVLRQALSRKEEDTENADEALLSLPLVSGGIPVAELGGRLTAAEQELSSLSEIYGPEHHSVKVARAEVELLRQRTRGLLVQLAESLDVRLSMLQEQQQGLQEQYDNGLRETLTQFADSYEARSEMLKEQEESLQRRYEEENRLARELDWRYAAYGWLNTALERKDQEYNILQARMGEVDLTGDYAKTNVQVIETADVPRSPYKPNKKLIAVQSAAVGLFLGVLLVFLLDYMDETLKTPEDLRERVGLTLLGSVPALRADCPKEERFSYRGRAVLTAPSSGAAEGYRQIRTNLLFSAAAAGSKVLAVTSSGPGDGKTTTAANLALAFAQSGKRVLLIDADLHVPRVHEVFGLEGAKGLGSVLVGEAEFEAAVQQVYYDGEVVNNLDVLAGLHSQPSPAELLDSESVRRLLEGARQNYDWVIIDTPPVLSVADASIVGAISDGVVLVLRAGASSRAMVRRAQIQLAGVNAHILGGVLNHMDVSGAGQYSQYYQGYARYHRERAGS